MINWKIIYRMLASLLWIEALMLLTCQGVGIFYEETDYTSFTIPAVLSVLLSIFFSVLSRGGDSYMGRRDGFLSVSASWVTFTAIGMLPLVLSDTAPRISAAFFETMSGFSTTGATALENIDDLPHSILFWRSLIHWTGGVGIVFFTVALLPSMGTSGLKLFSAESSGLKLGRLHPRIGTTARWLWGVYLLLTLLCGLAFYLGGMTPFDAVNHAFSTIATGGFSTHQASFAYFDSPTLDAIASFFMVVAGVNFTLLYLLLVRGRFRQVSRDSELRTYLSLLVGISLFLAAVLAISSRYTLLGSVRYAVFYTASLLSTTGFTSVDPMTWPSVTWIVLVVTSIVGACAGSTTGGIKIFRMLTCFKLFGAEFKRILHPAAVIPLRINGISLPSHIAQSVVAFFVAYAALTFGGALLYALMDVPLLDSLTMTLSMLSNAGPAYGNLIGPLASWSTQSDAALWLGSFLMLAGRLEIFTLLLPFVPAFWQDN